MLGPAAAEALPGGIDPAQRDAVAHTTAAALVRGAREAEDPAVIDRLVRLVETEGLDAVAALWADSPATSLPGALWRLYVLREWVRRDAGTVSLRYRLGLDAAPAGGGPAGPTVSEVVAGLGAGPGPEEVGRLADAVLSGVFAGELDVALDRAGSFCRILARGAAHDADAREAADADAAVRMTRGASALQRTAEELEHAAALWRGGLLE
ncbi:hypothetical protein [Cellulomonas sp. PhB143]|uniref:hypothetical protein n=1 Tax=Cellulomonas sp. PhB143 TaxID=2485186 RepID=UPI000F466428|nr:hypothetical protein [Cellulomonas sp. PhB143]ROS76564.1 hypothetical protein EDF32_1383 [Cellulomonas sp. PhB143]